MEGVVKVSKYLFVDENQSANEGQDFVSAACLYLNQEEKRTRQDVDDDGSAERRIDRLVRKRDALVEALLLSSNRNTTSSKEKKSKSTSRSRDHLNVSERKTNVSEKTKSSRVINNLSDEVANASRIVRRSRRSRSRSGGRSSKIDADTDDGQISSRRKKSLSRSDDEEGGGRGRGRSSGSSSLLCRTHARHQHYHDHEHHQQEQGLTATVSEGTPPRRGKTQRKEGRDETNSNSSQPLVLGGSGRLGRTTDLTASRRSSSPPLSSSSCSSNAPPSFSFPKRVTSTSTTTATPQPSGVDGQQCLLVVSAASVDCGCECHDQTRTRTVCRRSGRDLDIEAISSLPSKRKVGSATARRDVSGPTKAAVAAAEEEEAPRGGDLGVCFSKSDELKVVIGNESAKIRERASSASAHHDETVSDERARSNSGEIQIMSEECDRLTTKNEDCQESLHSKSDAHEIRGGADVYNAIVADFSSSSSNSSSTNSFKETQLLTETKQENDLEAQQEEEHQEHQQVNSSAHTTDDLLVRDERNTNHNHRLLAGSELLLGEGCREVSEKEKTPADPKEKPKSEPKRAPENRALAMETQNKQHSAERANAKATATAKTKSRNTERSTVVVEEKVNDENTRAVSVYSWRDALHGAIKSVTKGRAVSNSETVSPRPTPRYQEQQREDDKWEEKKVRKSGDRDVPASPELVVKKQSGTSETPVVKTSRSRKRVLVEEEMPKKSPSDSPSSYSESGLTANAVAAAAEVEILTTKSDALSKENTFLKSMLRTARDELRGALEEHSRYITTTSAGQERKHSSPLNQRNSTRINALSPVDHARLDSASISTRSRNPSKNNASSSSSAPFSCLVDPIIDYYENKKKHKAIVHEATLAFQRDVIREMLLLQKKEREEEEQRRAAADKATLLLMEHRGTEETEHCLLLQNTSNKSLPRREEGREEALPQHPSSCSSSGSDSSNSSPEKKKEKRSCGYVYPIMANPHPSHPSPSRGKEGYATRLSRSLGIHRELLRGMAPSVCDSSFEGRCSEHSVEERDKIKDQLNHEGMALHSLTSSSNPHYSLSAPIVDLLERENTLLRSQLKRSERSLELTARVLPIRSLLPSSPSPSFSTSSKGEVAMMLSVSGKNKKGQWSPNGGIGGSRTSHASNRDSRSEEVLTAKGAQCCSVMRHPHLHSSSVVVDTDTGSHARAGRGSLVVLGGPVVSHYYDASGQLVTPTETFRKVMNRAGTIYVKEVKKNERLAKEKIDIAESLEASERARAAAEAQRDGAMRLVADLTRSLEMSKSEVMRARAQSAAAAARSRRQSPRDIEEEDGEGEEWGLGYTEKVHRRSSSARPVGMNDSAHTHNSRSVQCRATNAHREGGANGKSHPTPRATKEEAGEEGFSLDELQQLFEKGCTFGEELEGRDALQNSSRGKQGREVRRRGRGGSSGSVFEVSKCFSEEEEEDKGFGKGGLGVRGGDTHHKKKSATGLTTTPTYLAVGAAKRLVKAVSDMVKEVDSVAAGASTEPEILVSIEKTNKEIVREGEPSAKTSSNANNNAVAAPAVTVESNEPWIRGACHKKEIEAHSADANADAARKRLREKHLPAVVDAVREVSAEFVYMRSREQQYLNLIVDDEMAEREKGIGNDKKEEGGQQRTEEEESTVAVVRDIVPKTVSSRVRGPPPSSSLYLHSRPLPNHPVPINHTAAPPLLRRAREGRQETTRLVSVADNGSRRSGTAASASALLTHQRTHVQQRGQERRRGGSAGSAASSSLPSEITNITNTSRITRGAVGV